MSPDEGQRDGGRGPETAIRALALVVALGVVALVAFDPTRIGSHGTLAERAAGAALLVGALGSAFRGFGLRGKRRHVRFLTHPAVCWPLIAVGLAGAFLL